MATSAEAEVEKIRMLEERIKAPSIWGRIPCGLRFEDLQDRRYEDAVGLLKKHYLSEEITYRSLKITDDQEGVDEFVHNARIWMKDKMSLAVVKEGTDKLVGVLIMRIQEKNAFSRTFSRVKITHNPLYSIVMKFNNEVEKPVDLYEKLGVKRYLKVYILALKMRYRHRGGEPVADHRALLQCITQMNDPPGYATRTLTREADTLPTVLSYCQKLLNSKSVFYAIEIGIGKEMLKAAMALAASALVPAVAGIFTTGRLHQIGEDLGFEKYNEIYYIRYLVNEKIVFWDAGLGNYGAALMAYRIPNVEEPEELQTQHSSRFTIQPLEEEDNASNVINADLK